MGNAGEMFVVPKGVEHKPYAEHEVKLMLVEPQGVRNTGEVVSERSAPRTIGSESLCKACCAS